jgi:ADP-dependent NAD(P)H-hydrate dehydratase / NAD(P)H-hydrate epimerase
MPYTHRIIKLIPFIKRFNLCFRKLANYSIKTKNCTFVICCNLIMKIFQTEQVRLIDQFTIENEPIASSHLMERAASKCTAWLINNYSRERSFKIFAGCGNNGGDGLAIARQLASNDYRVEVFLVKVSDTLSDDAKINLELIKKKKVIDIREISKSDHFPQIDADDVVIDALFGSGLTRPLTGLAAEMVKYLNHCSGTKISIDMPSGLPGEGIAKNDAVFKAHHVLTFQFPFLSFFYAENAEYIGSWHTLDISLLPLAIQQTPTHFFLTLADDIDIKKRPEFGHKGTFGHSLLISGSSGMAGAAILSAKASLKCGCGLVTVHLPKSMAAIMHTAFPEALVSIDEGVSVITALPDVSKYSAVAIGPGIGQAQETKKVLFQLIESCRIPLVLDADALNILASENQYINKLPKNSILTPHPGEFDRLFGKSSNSYERQLKQIEKSTELGVYIVLKGRYTCISTPDGCSYMNSTGNSGMATAGSGDILSGMIVSFLAQGYSPFEAAKTAVYMHGLAGDIASVELCPESVIASDIINYIHKAFNRIKLSKYEKT